jgi:hypothetical protein
MSNDIYEYQTCMVAIAISPMTLVRSVVGSDSRRTGADDGYGA